MTSGARLPTWNERENNKRRERRRRAVSAKIFAGLRMYGSYQLPKHCDNNEVLKALCAEAGWTVEPDGTTYRKGLKPASERKSEINPSASPSPCSSYKPTPSASYNPSPTSSSFPSPHINDTPINSLPWLKNLSSSSSSASSSKNSHPRSISAPITPPLSSPSSRTPRMKTDWDESPSQLPPPPPWAGWTFLPNSTPQSPGRHHQIIPSPDWLAGIQIPTGPTSPTFSLVSSHPFGVFKEAVSAGGSSRMWTPGQSGNCSPVMEGLLLHSEDIQMADEFAFGSSHEENTMAGMVKAWEGERIHEEDCGSDELELTLGNSRTRVESGVL